jgi:hypothetical protein
MSTNYSPIYDLPKTFTENGDPIVLDSFHNIYKPRQETEAVVYVEKLCGFKNAIVPLKLGTKKSDRSAFLVKEGNYTNLDGNLVTFERHYAEVPPTYVDYEITSYRVLWNGTVNFRTRTGSGSQWDRTRRTLAKVTKRYFLESQNAHSIPVLPTDFVPESDDAGTDFRDDFTKIFTIAPESRGANRYRGASPQKRVIAPDRIEIYLGNIYELSRFTVVL